MNPPTTFYPKPGVERSPFQISANQLEADENVNTAHFRTRLLAVKWCDEQSYSFHQSSKWVNADRAQYACSSRDSITILVMALLYMGIDGIHKFYALIRIVLTMIWKKVW